MCCFKLKCRQTKSKKGKSQHKNDWKKHRDDGGKNQFLLPIEFAFNSSPGNGTDHICQKINNNRFKDARHKREGRLQMTFKKRHIEPNNSPCVNDRPRLTCKFVTSHWLTSKQFWGIFNRS